MRTPHLSQNARQRLGVVQHRLIVECELGAKRFSEASRLAGHIGQHHRTLNAWEDPGVDLAAQRLIVPQHEASPRAAQGLVGRRSDDVGVGKRVRIKPGGDESGEMSHVHHQVGASLIGDCAEAGEVDGAGIGRAASDNQLWPLAQREVADLVEVDALAVPGDAVSGDVVIAPRQCRWVPVADVAARSNVHGEDLVAEPQQAEQDAGIGI